MKTKKFTILLIFLFIFSNGQVGINTVEPKATLDINGNLIIRNTSTLTELTSEHSILIRDKSALGDNEIKEISPELLNNNVSVYSASKNSSWQLLDLGLGTSWYKINLTGNTDTKIGNPSLFNSGVYTAPSSGIYTLNYEFQMQSGVDLELLGGKRLGVLKNNIVWEDKDFDAVRVSLLGITIAAVPVTSSTINTLVYLNAGDTITFAVNTGGLLPINLTLLTDSKVSLFIYKVSN